MMLAVGALLANSAPSSRGAALARGKTLQQVSQTLYTAAPLPYFCGVRMAVVATACKVAGSGSPIVVFAGSRAGACEQPRAMSIDEIAADSAAGRLSTF
jgi:hypothetical protein